MASHVVVVDSTARRHNVKTTPGTYLSDVFREACKKFSVNPDHHALKHNNKTVDLSLTMRLSGLSQGAKLTLVQASRSPSVVSVALQIPASTSSPGAQQPRLTDKFPSNTPIWQVLRKFEEGVAGNNNAQQNFTQRATPQVTSPGGTGAGRLCYMMPVVHILGRDLSTFTDLQKTLAQFGVNSGSVLLKLSFRNSEQLLEDAMADISQYFQAVEEPKSGLSKGKEVQMDGTAETSSSVPADAGPEAAIAEKPLETDDVSMRDVSGQEALGNVNTAAAETHATSYPTNGTESPIPLEDGVKIYAPPTTNTPAASKQSHNEADYIPSVEHAKLHQSRLNTESRNRRLLSDNEIAQQEQARQEALAQIKSVTVKFRFPDQATIERPFDQSGTVKDLFQTCRKYMNRPNNESFGIRATDAKGKPMALLESGDGARRLTGDLGWQDRVLITIIWGDDVSPETRKKPSLKEEYRSQAQQLKINLPESGPSGSGGPIQGGSAEQGEGDKKGKGKAENTEAKLKKFLGFGKK